MNPDKNASLTALATERALRLAAEAEVVRLRAQLQHPAAGSNAGSVSQQPTPQVPELLAAASQLRGMKRRLLEQQELMEQIIATSPNFICVEDAQGQIIMTNRDTGHIRCWQASRTQYTFLPPYPSVSGEMPPAISFEECYELTDGETHWFQTTQSALLRDDGTYYRFTFSSDITTLKHVTQLVEDSVRTRLLFMANMSHEIRTPLHGIMGLVQMLLKQPLNSEQADFAGMINSSTENLLVVVNDILDFTKIESGNLVLEKIPFDIAQTVQDALRPLEFVAAEKGLRLTVEERALPVVVGDPHRLRQVLNNLLGNAIKFTQRGHVSIAIEATATKAAATLASIGSLSASESVEGLLVAFRITDTGIGIRPEKLEQVFDSFQQADATTTRLYGGTGLGLAICKNLVELQGGTIEVASTVGEGSTFRFVIPYALSTEPLPPATTKVLPPDLLMGLRILFVEDNALNQLIAVSLMHQWQMHVDLAHNGQEAVNKASVHEYDLILMDVQMPQMDGIEATARIRQAGPNHLTPIVALTADALRINGDNCQGFGFVDFLAKPYSEQDLHHIIARTSQRTADELPILAPGQVGLAEQAVPSPVAEMLPKQGHYDFQLLGKLASNPHFMRKMLTLFVTQVPLQLRRLHEAAEQQQWDIVTKEAHMLKTTFGTFNMQPETEQLRRIEQLGTVQTSTLELLPLIHTVKESSNRFIELFLVELDK